MDDITWITRASGRESQLMKLNAERNDYNLSRSRRWTADKTLSYIVNQLEDRKLMAMRERLIKAAKAGDIHEQAKITAEMRAHTKEDQMTGFES